jgi:hypothetical protein
MMLDADEKMEETLTDDEALCLDTNRYGNIARFLTTVVVIPIWYTTMSTLNLVALKCSMYFSKQLTLWFMHPMLFMLFLNPTVDL